MTTKQDSQKSLVSVNGTELMVEEAGAGAETLVCAPALFTNKELFDPLIATMSSDHRCIRYDHRGQGESGLGAPQPSADGLGTEGLYEDAVVLLDKLEVDSCHWVGASVGGFVGVRLAVRHPERIRSLVLIGMTVEPLSRAVLLYVDLFGGALRASSRLGPLGAGLRTRLATRSMRNMLGPTFMSDPARADDREAWRQRWEAQMVPQAVPMMRQVFGTAGNPPELLAQVQAPTLVVVGEEEAGGDTDARKAQQAIPNARLVPIPRAGHMVLVEQPEAGARTITGFIREVEAA
jgi:3-oxoadipate enol-lactonase